MKKLGNKSKQALRAPNGQLLPGSTANPDGRPALPEEVRAGLTTRFLAGNAKAMDRLEQLMQSDDENVALKAALGWLAKTIKDGVIIELVGKEGEAVKLALETKVTHDVDPASALRVIRLLVTSGALPEGVVGSREAGDTENDEVHDSGANPSPAGVPRS